MIQRPILLLGNTGQLGWELQRCLVGFGNVIALDYPQLDLSHPDEIRSTIQAVQPGLIINA